MFNKRNKKKGFTLIELIIVIAIIAILAAIAVPAFGQIRQNANASADLANARTMFSVVSAAITDESITLPAPDGNDLVTKYYDIEEVGEATVPFDVTDSMTEVKVKQNPNAQFVVQLTSHGDITIGYSIDETISNDVTEPTDYHVLYGASATESSN